MHILCIVYCKPKCSVSHVVAGQSTYMSITQIILPLSLLGSTLILFISGETLTEYVVEDDKLDMELDNAPEYKYLEWLLCWR